MDSSPLRGKTALVTGAGQGIGRAIALTLSGQGAYVLAADVVQESVEHLVSELPPRRAIAVRADVTDISDIDSMVRQCRRSFGSVDILVNNAGCNVRKSFLDTTWDDWNTVLETNLRGGFFVTQAFAPPMIARGYGRVINIGSVTSVFGFGAVVPYVASRGGVLQMSRALADTLGPHGITVNCLAPGWFHTAQTEALFQDGEWQDYIIDRIPLKRLGTPTDLDGAVVFLSSEASSYVTGQILLVDGGMTTGAARAANPKS